MGMRAGELFDDRFEEPGLDRRIVDDGIVAALLGKPRIGRGIELCRVIAWPWRSRRRNRPAKVARNLEMLVGKAAAAGTACCGRTNLPGWSAQQLQARLHAGHGIDLAGQPPVRRRSSSRLSEVMRRPDRPGRPESPSWFTTANALLGIDEQPLPVLPEPPGCRLAGGPRRSRGRDRACGATPDQHADGDDDQRRHQPDHGVDLGRVGPGWLVPGIAVGGAVAPGEQKGHDDDRDDHEHHHGKGVEQAGRARRRRSAPLGLSTTARSQAAGQKGQPRESPPQRTLTIVCFTPPARTLH